MATKRKGPTASRPGVAAGVKQGEMTEGDMNRPFKEGLMEMPSGGEMQGGGGAGGGGRPGPRPGMGGGGTMPGEGAAGGGGSSGAEMPGGEMEAT